MKLQTVHAKTADPIEMPLDGDSSGPKKACNSNRWDQGRANPFAAGRGDKSAMRPFVKIL